MGWCAIFHITNRTIALPFLTKDSKSVVVASVVFASVFFLVTGLFEKTGIGFVSSLNGFFLVGCTGFLIACSILKK
uniref:Uncharacterized protein n=1 Tax=uncultured marine thaumarchaeote AD1000_44_B05 TaxID=1455917 RepID=A0A075FX84_9ARCH|nr:hypothetical protein [uncultured marine thaumarchaeote AD1000_44_B05]